MKVRSGFVSNSSSSSFLIYGAWIDNDEAREKLLSDEEKKELAEIEETEPYELGVKSDDLKTQFKDEFATWQGFKDRYNK